MRMQRYRARPCIDVAPLELDAFLGLHPGGEVMLDQRHLGHQIGRLDQRRLGVAAGDHDMQAVPPRRMAS